MMQCVLRVADLERAVRFYRDDLGLAEAFRVPIPNPTGGTDHAVFFRGRDLLPSLGLYAVRAHSEPYEVGTGFSHLVIAVDDYEATVARLTVRDVPLDVHTDGPQGALDQGRSIFVRDPDGYMVCLIPAPRG